MACNRCDRFIKSSSITTTSTNLVITLSTTPTPVSYTHLDVYKRQVLCISSHAESSEDHADYIIVEIKNLSNQKEWRYRSEGFNFYDQWYVGVTPNKTYKLSLYVGAEYNLYGGYLKISYSQSINQKIPNVTDY